MLSELEIKQIDNEVERLKIKLQDESTSLTAYFYVAMTFLAAYFSIQVSNIDAALKSSATIAMIIVIFILAIFMLKDTNSYKTNLDKINRLLAEKAAILKKQYGLLERKMK